MPSYTINLPHGDIIVGKDLPTKKSSPPRYFSYHHPSAYFDKSCLDDDRFVKKSVKPKIKKNIAELVVILEQKNKLEEQAGKLHEQAGKLANNLYNKINLLYKK